MLYLGVTGWGQIIQWNTFGNLGTETTEPSTYNDPNVSSANLTQGTITPAGNANRFGGTTWFNTGNTVTGNTLTEAVAGNDYIQFIVTPNSGFSFTPTSLYFSWQSSSLGPNTVTLRSSADSYVTDIGSTAVTTSIATYTITISGLSNITTATTFRLYGYGATSTSGTGGFDVEINVVDVQLNGITAPTGNTAPTVTTQAVSSTSTTTATGNGNISATGGVNPTARGFCWDLASNADPDITNSKVEETGDFSTGAFIGSITGLTSGTQYKVRAFATNEVNTGYGSVVTFYTLATEPTNHPTSFSAIANSSSQITITWTDATGGQLPDAYLVKATVDPSTPTTPVDGTAEVDAALVKNITQGTQNAIFTGLNSTTTYNLSIWPYTNSEASIDYKIESQPTTNAITLETASIKWDGGASTTAFTDANNWNGNVVPTSTDDVLLDNSLVAGSYSVELPSGAIKTSINRLTITPNLSNTITLILPSANTYGVSNDAGLVVGDNTLSTDDIILNEGGVLVNASGGTIGNGIQVNTPANGTLSINNGGKYIHNSIRSTGGTALAAVLSSISGTENGTYEYDVPGNVSFAIAATGRNYGNLVLNKTSGTGAYTSSGVSALTVRGNLIINSGVTYTTTMTGAMNIAGNLTNNGTALTIAATQAVNFNSTSSQLISGSNNITFVGAVSIGASSTIQIAQNIGVTVSGILTNSAGTAGLFIFSDVIGTGSLIHSTASVPATVQRYVPAATWTDWQDGWHALSSPVSAQAVSGFTESTVADYDIYSWYEEGNIWVNYKNTDVAPTWNTANTITNGLSNDAANFLVGKGYLVSYKNNVTKSFTGNLNNADVAISGLNITGGGDKSFHMLGNPYASALLWDATWTKSNIAATIQVWSEALQDYSAVDYGSYIPAMNGFMVELSADAASITIPAAKRAHNATSWYKNQTANMQRLKLTVMAADGGSGKEAIIRFDPMSTNSFDSDFDGSYLQGYGPMFYSNAGEQLLSVNTLPALTNTTEIPLTFVRNYSTDFTLRAEGTETISADIYLNDLKTGTSQNLRLNPVYSFSSSDNDSPNRFKITFGAVGIDETDNQNTLQAYVNGNRLFIMNTYGNASVQLFDLQGRLVQSSQLNGEGLQSQPLNLPAGVYIVSVQNEKSVKSVKIVISE